MYRGSNGQAKKIVIEIKLRKFSNVIQRYFFLSLIREAWNFLLSKFQILSGSLFIGWIQIMEVTVVIIIYLETFEIPWIFHCGNGSFSMMLVVSYICFYFIARSTKSSSTAGNALKLCIAKIFVNEAIVLRKA